VLIIIVSVLHEVVILELELYLLFIADRISSYVARGRDQFNGDSIILIYVYGN
jgi:hypothetical protein